jgi:hypothetical protein
MGLQIYSLEANIKKLNGHNVFSLKDIDLNGSGTERNIFSLTLLFSPMSASRSSVTSPVIIPR